MRYSKNYNLKLPEGDDVASPSPITEDMEVIDAKLKELEDFNKTTAFTVSAFEDNFEPAEIYVSNSAGMSHLEIGLRATKDLTGTVLIANSDAGLMGNGHNIFGTAFIDRDLQDYRTYPIFIGGNDEVIYFRVKDIIKKGSYITGFAVFPGRAI